MSLFKRKGGRVVEPVVPDGTPRIVEGVAIACGSLVGNNRGQSKFIEARILEAVKEAQRGGVSTAALKRVIEDARVRAKREFASRP